MSQEEQLCQIILKSIQIMVQTHAHKQAHRYYTEVPLWRLRLTHHKQAGQKLKSN